jgi:hypothetical protein
LIKAREEKKQTKYLDLMMKERNLGSYKGEW